MISKSVTPFSFSFVAAYDNGESTLLPTMG